METPRATLAAFVFAVLMAVAVAPHPATAAITCRQVEMAITPCIMYARTGGTIPQHCCKGVRVLNSAATTTPERQQACTCLKKIIPSIDGIQMSIVTEIPKKCDVDIGYPISLSTNCSKVK